MTLTLRTARKTALAIACIATGIAASNSSAQDTAQRRLIFIDTFAPDAQHVLLVDPNSTTNNCTLEWYPDLSAPAITLVVPFQRAGSISIPEGVDPQIVLSGWRLDGTGVISRIALDSTTMTLSIVESREYSGMDPLGIASTGDRLFVLDLTGKKIVTALWDEGTPLPMPQDFELAHHFTNPRLPVIDLKLAPLFDSAGEIASDACVYFQFNSNGPPTSLVSDPQGGWAPVLEEQNELPYEGPYKVIKPQAVSSLGPIQVWGSIGSFIVKNLETGDNVASGSISSSSIDSTTTVTPSTEMQLGVPHAVMNTSGQYASEEFLPTVRHGNPMWLGTAGFTKGKLGGAMAIGDSDFRSRVYLGFDDLTTTQLSLPVSVWYNWRDPVTGQDPVILVGESAQLIGAIGMQNLTLDVSENMIGKEVGMQLPIPNDPNLVGRVLLFQWATLTPDTESLVLSDVYGTVIQSTGQAAMSSPASGAAPTEVGTQRTFEMSNRILSTPPHNLLRDKIRASARAMATKKR